jgi:hypothetical protein
MAKTFEITTKLAGPWYAFPGSESGFANWATARRVEGSGSADRWKFTVDDTQYGPLWYVFRGATAPTSWDDSEAVANVGGLTAEDVQQVRYRLGMDGDVLEPSTPVTDTVVIPPPTSDLKCVGYLLCLDTALDPEPGVEVSFRMIRGPGVAGFSYNTPIETVTSNSEGVALMESLRRGSTIEYWRSGASQNNRKTAVIPNAQNVALPELL